MPSQTLQPDARLGKVTVVIIIVIIWAIMTIRTGPYWLTPTELAFFALLLNRSLPSIASPSN